MRQSRREARSQELATPSATIAISSRLALKPLRSAAVLCPAAGSDRHLALPDAAQELVLADHRSRRLDQRHQHTSQARPPSLIGRPSAKIPNRPNSTIAGGVAEANYGR